MVEITILELNLDAEDLIANAPFSSGRWGDDEDADGDEAGFLPALDDDDDEDDAGAADGPNLKPVAIGAGLLVLVLLVVAVRRVLGGEPEPLP